MNNSSQVVSSDTPPKQIAAFIDANADKEFEVTRYQTSDGNVTPSIRFRVKKGGCYKDLVKESLPRLAEFRDRSKTHEDVCDKLKKRWEAAVSDTGGGKKSAGDMVEFGENGVCWLSSDQETVIVTSVEQTSDRSPRMASSFKDERALIEYEITSQIPASRYVPRLNLRHGKFKDLRVL